MSIPSYQYPQSRLFQFLANVSAADTTTKRPLGIGPSYLLSRYGKETVPSFAFASAGQTVPAQYINSSGVATALVNGAHSVDLDYTRLFGKGLEATLATFTSGAKVVSAAKSNVVSLNTSNFKGTSLHANFSARDTQIGDIAYITTGGTTVRRKVTGFVGEDVAADFGYDGANGLVGNSDYNIATLGASVVTPVSASALTGTLGSAITVTNPDTFNGNATGAKHSIYIGDLFTFTITAIDGSGIATVAVTSATGLYSGSITAGAGGAAANQVFTGTLAKLGSITITVTLVYAHTGALTVGDVFTFSIHQIATRIVPTVAGTYVGNKDSTYMIEVLTATHTADADDSVATFRVSDTAGLDTPETTTVPVLMDGTGTVDLGTSGLTITFGDLTAVCPQGGLRVGDVYYVKGTAATNSTTAFDRIVLDGPAVDTSVFVNFATDVTLGLRTAFTGEIARTAASDDEAWTSASSGAVVQAGLQLEVADRTSAWCNFVTAVGTLSLYFRALSIPPSTEGLVAFSTEAEIIENWGIIDIDNDAAFGANEILRGTGGLVTGYMLRTNGRDATAFALALKKAEHNSLVYALAPLTDDFAAAQAVVTHCDAMSGPTKKKFRRCYVGTDSPGEYAALTEFDSNPLTCTIQDFYGGGNKLVTFTNPDIDLSIYELAEGDLLKLTVLDEEYEIASILSDTELILSGTGRGSALGVAGVCELWHADTPASQAAFVRTRSSAMNSRRAANVWVENGTAVIDDVTTVIPNRYHAAHVAGLRCALLPQQGLTRTEVSSFSNAAAMYLRYDDDALDAIAADGTWIITQNAESGAIYIRHQLTTGVSEGALAYEDSVGVGVDSLSFTTASIVDKYIGVKNLTRETMTELRNELHDAFTAATQSTYGEDAGALLIRFEDLKITPDVILKDRAKITVTWVFALPFNIGDVYVNVVQDVTLAPIVA